VEKGSLELGIHQSEMIIIELDRKDLHSCWLFFSQSLGKVKQIQYIGPVAQLLNLSSSCPTSISEWTVCCINFLFPPNLLNFWHIDNPESTNPRY
jgi:hypothetical protein